MGFATDQEVEDSEFKEQSSVHPLNLAVPCNLFKWPWQLGAGKPGFYGLVGDCAAMQRLFRRIEAAASIRSTVLIVGESGTGKELVAKAIHECGSQHRPFVPFNCAAIPGDLVESELFGHRRGAFSGANTDFPGLLRAAEGGTVFFDEITEMRSDTQAKLLRVLQERAVRPVGATHEIPIDVRMIASTNRDPGEAMRAGRLRGDLYYRLNVNVLEILPLRERREDIAALVEYFIAVFNQRRLRYVKDVEADAIEALKAYEWPGNVRELSNVIESAFTFGTSETITLDDLPAKVAESRPAVGSSVEPPTSGDDLDRRAERRQMFGSFAEFERDLVVRALEHTSGNKVQAARLLKISRKKLYARINRYGLTGGTAKPATKKRGALNLT